jgi:L-alanine-DL-glutamate epimerase-like enolase superfamily enzyme
MSDNPRLKITDIKVVNLRTIEEVGEMEPAWDLGGRMRFHRGGGSFTEVHTDQGIVGIGPRTDPSLIPKAKSLLIGKDPFDTERHTATLRYYAEGIPYQGVAGIDIALWDIIGKASGQPLYKLWGGAKDRVKPYASLIKLSTPEERAEMAATLKSQGWKALKLRIHHETLKQDIELVEAVRKAVGDDMDIMVDANQAQSSGDWQPGVQWDFRRAVDTARELQQLGCFWLEEPLPRFYFHRLSELQQKVEIPIAGGENNRLVPEFLWMCQEGVYDVLQPESMVMDGVTALRKIGVLAEVYGKKIVPHHGGGDLGVIAHLHLVASWRHAPYMELLHDPPIADYRHRFSIMSNPPITDDDGYMAVPQGPGLGVEIDKDLILKD